jgi:ethanolamine utilization protein EutA
MAAPTTLLVGLDFGTTTSSGLVAEATVRRNAVTGRMDWGAVRETFRSPLVFTPLSEHATAAFAALGIAARPGDDLAAADLDLLLDWYLARLDRAVGGGAIDPAAREWLGHLQVPFRMPAEATAAEPIVTLSGGVGDLVYAAVAGRAVAEVTPFGDLGVDLARRLLAHPRWSGQWSDWVPVGGGRATVAGLLRHATRISGASIHFPDRGHLPLADLPIVGTLTAGADDRLVAAVLDLARRCPGGRRCG